MQRAFRVFELAVRLAVRTVGTDTSSIKTGGLVDETENYLRRLGRLKKQGKVVQFFKLLRNAQSKLARLVCILLH
jgi:hypothetical protein